MFGHLGAAAVVGARRATTRVQAGQGSPRRPGSPECTSGGNTADEGGQLAARTAAIDETGATDFEAEGARG